MIHSESFGEIESPQHNITKEKAMDRFNNTTMIPDRERGQHLKFEDRCTIKIYKKQGYSLRGIAEVIDCSPSTVMYELRRGTGERNGSRGRFPEYSAK
ncbi:MAG: helix-turn-helix domain-containing protein [Bacteroidales bacterium]|nr:helix-turn-helix domain-containing protein [Bacteroidales bacterium]